MPIKDRHRVRTVSIEYQEAGPSKGSLAVPLDQAGFFLAVSGRGDFEINGRGESVVAPCVLMLSPYDVINTIHWDKLALQVFSFSPLFLNSSLTFERLQKNDFEKLMDMHDRNLMDMFLKRDEKYNGVLDITPESRIRLEEWMAVIHHETKNQTDGRWTCRIRRYLLQSLYLCEDIYMDRENWPVIKGNKSPADVALEYIHTNYNKDITLDGLCTIVHINRTSLNKMLKEKTGHTAIDYLLNYRIKMACELLDHTNLTIMEIAEAVGFHHDTYFIKQFIKKMDMTPSYYRRVIWSCQNPDQYKR